MIKFIEGLSSLNTVTLGVEFAHMGSSFASLHPCRTPVKGVSTQGSLVSVVLTLRSRGWELSLHQDMRNFKSGFSRLLKNSNEGLS